MSLSLSMTAILTGMASSLSNASMIEIPMVLACSSLRYLRIGGSASMTDCLTCAETVSLDNLSRWGSRSSITTCLGRFWQSKGSLRIAMDLTSYSGSFSNSSNDSLISFLITALSTHPMILAQASIREYLILQLFLSLSTTFMYFTNFSGISSFLKYLDITGMISKAFTLTTSMMSWMNLCHSSKISVLITSFETTSAYASTASEILLLTIGESSLPNRLKITLSSPWISALTLGQQMGINPHTATLDECAVASSLAILSMSGKQ